MSAIENFIKSIGYSSLVAAGIGNMFSDVIGAICGGMVIWNYVVKIHVLHIHHKWKYLEYKNKNIEKNGMTRHKF